MEERKSTLIRFGIIFFIICLMFSAVIYKIVRTQYFERDRYMAVAQKFPVSNIIEASRGNIYDCQHRLLAASRPTYIYFLDTKVDPLRVKDGNLFYDNVDALADSLSTYFGDRTKKQYKKYLIEGYNKGSRRWRLTPRRISYTEKQRLQSFPLIGLDANKGGCYTEKGFERINPYGSLAKSTIGNIYGETGTGSSGLEMQYNEFLMGVNGISETHTWGGKGRNTFSKPREGQDIISTIDADIQDFVEMALYSTIDRAQADWGCCILMETRTGEIKALSNLTRQTNGSYNDEENFAIKRIEPGSTFKTIALMSILEDGKYKLTDSIEAGSYNKNGQWDWKWTYTDPKHPISDHKYPRRKLSVEEALAGSSNIVMAKMLTTTYNHNAEPYLERLKSIGVCDSIPVALPYAQHSKIQYTNNKETFARMAFGYFVELTPMEILTFYNGIANGGKMIRPILVKAIMEDDKVVEKYKAETIVSQMCKKKTLKNIQQCLEGVVWNDEFGTASKKKDGLARAQSTKVKIAGKTGTARLWDSSIKQYRNDRHRILFCGYFPADNPQYTCICVLSRPRNGSDAGYFCGSTVRTVAEKVMALTAEQDLDDFLPEKTEQQRPDIKGGMAESIKTATKGKNVKLKHRSKGEWATVVDGQKTADVDVNTTTVPNVVGMGARDAVFAIEQTGMRVKLQGTGRVVSQSVKAGAKITSGGTVYLTLR